jgi:hypothetical protein
VNFDEDILSGYGKRIYNWEFTAGAQRELLPRVSADVTYFRRWYGNMNLTDNRAVTAADFTPFSITAPSDSRLANGGGYTISGLYDVNPARFGITDNIVTFAKNYGDWLRRWDGVALTVNARLASNFVLQGGVDTGTLTQDICEIRAQLPELVITDTNAAFSGPSSPFVSPINPYCHTEEGSTQLKMLGTYTVPRIDVQVSGTLQNIPGPEMAANFTATNQNVMPSLGRPLSGNVANVAVNLVEPGTMYAERLTQLDLRVAKLLRFGRTRATLQLDVYNALNADTVLTMSTAYATWQRPQSIILPRFAKFGLQFDF